MDTGRIWGGIYIYISPPIYVRGLHLLKSLAAATLYAMMSAPWAAFAAMFAIWSEPTSTAGGKPSYGGTRVHTQVARDEGSQLSVAGDGGPCEDGVAGGEAKF